MDYINSYSVNQYAFLAVPYLLIEHPAYADLGAAEKILYAMMLNRQTLSYRNADFVDKQGRVYIVYTVEQVCRDMHVSRPTAIRYLKNLTDIGLIERVRKGQGKSTCTYLKDFASVQKYYLQDANNKPREPLEKEPPDRYQNVTSRSKEMLPQEVKNLYPSKIDLSKTDLSNPSLKKDTVMLGKRRNIRLTEMELEGLREDYGTRFNQLLDECSDRIFGRDDAAGPIKNYYRYIQTIAKTLGYETDAETTAAAEAKLLAEAERKKAEDDRAATEVANWYEEKKQEYGVGTKEEVDRIFDERRKKLMEKWKSGDF